ncbi:MULTISPECIES: NapC/NirT family cytochrome c [Sporomusa]|uniref:NapC/NirT family cytochrome c n=1 Tax=Sporomusa TaxID=2375 RepID=UPI001CB7E2A9|nr:NapC/NirT family cytochrome c [Sporomusa sp. GT1]MCM0757000.1 NapC/NirT family cytochrome c [Sporomusa sphaeroides DSM 2875]
MGWKKYLERNTLAFMLIGALAAIAGFAIAGGGIAYADKASFCSSCHSMQHAAVTWQASNHRQFSCGDCHLPQENLVEKMIVKGQTGMHDTYHEFLRDYPDTIRISAKGRAIVNDNCARCHAYTIGNTFMSASGGYACTKCHRGMIHNQIVVKEGVPVE